MVYFVGTISVGNSKLGLKLTEVYTRPCHSLLCHPHCYNMAVLANQRSNQEGTVQNSGDYFLQFFQFQARNKMSPRPWLTSHRPYSPVVCSWANQSQSTGDRFVNDWLKPIVSHFLGMQMLSPEQKLELYEWERRGLAERSTAYSLAQMGTNYAVTSWPSH